MRRRDADALAACEQIERKLRKINPVLPAMRWRVHVRSRVCDHLDLSDLERGPARVERAGGFTTEVVCDDRAGQALVRDHPGADRVAEVDEPDHPAIVSPDETAAGGTLPASPQTPLLRRARTAKLGPAAAAS